MNILCIEQFSTLGGGQRSLMDLLPAFAARGWTPRVAVPSAGLFSEELHRIGYAIDYLNCSRYTNGRKPLFEVLKYTCDLPRLAREIERIISRWDIDFFYVNGSRFLPPVAWISRRRAIPLIFHCHCRLQQKSAIRLAGESLRLSQAQVIACCQYVAAPLAKYVSKERLRVLYNGVARNQKSFYRRPKLRNIGVVGRIEPEKGQMEFVLAARLIAREFPDCRFSIVGAPMFSGAQYFENVIAASRGLPVKFIKWQHNLDAVFSGLDLLVVPSTSVDATPRVILEAFAAGVPVLAFPSGGIPEIIKDGETGFLAASATSVSLVERIRTVLNLGPAAIFEVTTRAKQSWEANYTLESYQQHVCDLVGSLN